VSHRLLSLIKDILLSDKNKHEDDRRMKIPFELGSSILKSIILPKESRVLSQLVSLCRRQV